MDPQMTITLGVLAIVVLALSFLRTAPDLILLGGLVRSIDDLLARAAQSKWGAASNASILGEQRIREMADKYLP